MTTSEHTDRSVPQLGRPAGRQPKAGTGNGKAEREAMRLSPQRVARWSAGHRFTMIGIWVVLFLVGGLLTSKFLSGALTTQADFTNNPDSKQAQQLLEQRLSGPRRSNEVVIVRSESRTVTDPQFKAYVQRLTGDIDALKPGVVQATEDPYRAGGRFVSDDRHAILIPLIMAGSLDDANANIDQVLDRTLHAQHPQGFKVWVAGEATAAKDSNTIAEQDLRQGETIGILAALLGFSLFLGSRYREERARGRCKLAAIGPGGGTAKRAVFFPGVTVVL